MIVGKYHSEFFAWRKIVEGTYEGIPKHEGGNPVVIQKTEHLWKMFRPNGSCETARTFENAKLLADDMVRSTQRGKFYESMKNHYLLPVQHAKLLVTLTESDNTYIKYPARGVLHMIEIGNDLKVTQAVFHALKSDGSLGAPVTVKKPKFTYED